MKGTTQHIRVMGQLPTGSIFQHKTKRFFSEQKARDFMANQIAHGFYYHAYRVVTNRSDGSAKYEYLS